MRQILLQSDFVIVALVSAHTLKAFSSEKSCLRFKNEMDLSNALFVKTRKKNELLEVVQKHNLVIRVRINIYR